jgi:AraC-like DNA-binding protein
MLHLNDPPDSGTADAPWISTRHIQSAVMFLASRGLPCDVWLAQAGVAPQALRDADGRTELAAVERLLSIVQRELAAPCLGIEMARSISPASFGVLGFLFQASSTLGDLLATLVRYNGLMSNVGLTQLSPGPGTVTLSWACLAGGPAFQRVGAEFILGACSVIIRTLAPTLPRPVVVRFRHAASEEVHQRLSDHFMCPVHLQQPDNAIVIPVSLLGVHLPHGDAELKAMLDLRAQHLLESRASPRSVLDDVRRHVRQALMQGPPVRQDIAKRMGLSESTLHRRLQEERCNFQGLVDEVRLQVATHTLSQGGVSASTIANRLGFSSPQVFTRWFRQQTGLTPGLYRTQAVAQEEPQT